MQSGMLQLIFAIHFGNYRLISPNQLKVALHSAATHDLNILLFSAFEFAFELSRIAITIAIAITTSYQRSI